MKKIFMMIIIIIVSNSFMTSAAAQTCPANVSIVNGLYEPSAEWNVTLEKLDDANEKLYFYIATYNFDQRIGGNDNRISCRYKDRKNNYNLEITTKKANFMKPSSALWKSLDGESLVCFPKTPLAASECGWD